MCLLSLPKRVHIQTYTCTYIYLFSLLLLSRAQSRCSWCVRALLYYWQSADFSFYLHCICCWSLQLINMPAFLLLPSKMLAYKFHHSFCNTRKVFLLHMRFFIYLDISSRLSIFPFVAYCNTNLWNVRAITNKNFH